MFCPKCGSQNVEQSKFCRGCGADVSSVSAAMAGKPPARITAERHLELQSQSIRGLVLGAGFLFVAALAFALSTRALVVTLFALAFAFVFLSSGIARLVQARGLRALDKLDDRPELRSPWTEFVPPAGSIYETDELAPLSVTEHTTKHLDNLNAPKDN
jgi:hypothetical protein